MTRLRLLLVAATLCAPVLAGPAPRDVLLDLLANPPARPCTWFASTDPRHKNHDYLELKAGETRHIPLAAGRLERLWCTATEPDKVSVELSTGPSGEGREGNSLVLLDQGRAHAGTFYEKALALYPVGSAVGLNQLSTGAALIVTNRAADTNKFFYQVAIRPGVKTAVPPPRATAIDRVRQNKQLAAGERWTFFTAQGPQIVNEVELVLNPATLDAWRSVRLVERWGSDKQDAVNVPLLAFAAQFFGLQAVDNAVCSFDGKTLRMRAPMPLGGTAGGTLSLLNTGSAPVQATVSVSSAKTTGAIPPYSFCAVYGSTRTQRGRPVQMLKASGSGFFIGLALGIEPAPGSPRRLFAYLEGNETITADGKTYEGTGAEDFFDSAWYFPEKPFSQPYYGMTFKHKLPPQVSMYRLMIPDAMPFQKSLTFAFEHGSHNNSDDLLYRWVAFWYQKSPLQFQVADTLSAVPPAGSASEPARAAGDGTSKIIAVLVGLAGISAGLFAARKLRGR